MSSQIVQIPLIECVESETLSRKTRRLRDEFFNAVDALNDTINELEKFGYLVEIKVNHYKTETIVNPSIIKAELT